jgi:phosphatidylethanolamine-binding protein
MRSLLPVLLISSAAGWRLPHVSDGQTLIREQHSLPSTIRDTLIANEIIGDVLDDFEPTYYVDITYPKHHESVLLGNDIPVKAVQKRPTFSFQSISLDTRMAKNSTFTLVLTDPDAKSRENPKWSEMCHWILTNLTTPVSEPPPELLKEEGELKGYKPPGPPPKTGAHRYVFVLLEGDNADIKPPNARQHWGYGKERKGVKKWAAENNLTVVGANFFFAQNEKQ